MEHNEEEARRAMDIAEKKLLEKDYVGAKKLVNKAQFLNPKLEGLQQVLMMIDVYISASKIGKRKSDWYRVLGVDPLADDVTVKKKYKKLALLLHPDKNKFHGAEEAFKLVSEAVCVYEAKKVGIEAKREKSSSKWEPTEPPQEPPIPKRQAKPEPKYETEAMKRMLISTFWTMCSRCKTYCEYVRADYLHKTMPCPNCGKNFVASEVTPEIINGRPFIRLTPSVHSAKKHTPSESDSANGTNQQPYKRVKRWFDATHDSSSNVEKVTTFWTVCHRCKTYCKFVRANHLNKILPCPNCCQDFVAGEIIPEIIKGSPAIRLTPNFQSTSGPSCAFKAERNFNGTWYR